MGKGKQVRDNIRSFDLINTIRGIDSLTRFGRHARIIARLSDRHVMEIRDRKVVYSTPYCNLIAKTIRGQESSTPYFAVEVPDYISIVALTVQREIVLVKQFRPAIDA